VAILLSCQGGSGSWSGALTKDAEEVIARIPANTDGAEIKMDGSGDLDLKLYDGDTCIRGYDCTYASAGDQTYGGISISFSGDDTSPPVSETIKITGTTDKELQFRVHAYASFTGTATYTIGAIDPCDLSSQCVPCSSYTGCGKGQTPSCDGSATVTCQACPSDQYQTVKIFVSCEGSSGSWEGALTKDAKEVIAIIPANTNGATITMDGSGDLDLNLYDGETCIRGYGCTYAAAGDQTYEGVTIAFTGDDTSVPVSETITITGKTNREFQFRVTAYESFAGTAYFTIGPVDPCNEDDSSQCAACSSYTSCPKGETPMCDGSSTVTCGVATGTTTEAIITISTSVAKGVAAGATEIRLADVTGLLVGMLLTISGDGNSETKTITAVTPDSRRLSSRQLAAVPGMVTIDSPLQHDYPSGATITATTAQATTTVVKATTDGCLRQYDMVLPTLAILSLALLV